MNKEYLQIANSLGFWIIAFIMISLVIFQALLFMNKAFQVGRKIGMSEIQLKSALRAGIITSFGPSFAVLIGMVALITLIGAPMAWMRLSVIGAVMFETMATNAGAQALGVKLASPEYGLVGFANSLWVMSLGSVGWLLITGLFTHKLGDIRTALVRGKEEMLPVITIGAILGAFGYQFSQSLVVMGKPTIAALVSAGLMILFDFLSTKLNLRWLKEWSLGFAMVVGMFSAVIFV